MSDDSKSRPVEYELDRGTVQLAWLRFLQLRPEAATIAPLTQYAHFNGWLRAQGQRQVRLVLFYQVLSHVARYHPKGN
jgi:hypothetical protein